MSTSVLGSLFLGAIIVFGTYLLWRQFFARGRVPLWLPWELRSAQLVNSETTIVGFARARLSGVPDREYKTSDGRHIPMEFKRRLKTQAYLSDVIQLSTYRMIREVTGTNVADHGYVVAINPHTQEKTPIRVVLLRNEVMMKLMDRYLGIKRGQISPERTPNKSLCSKCEYSVDARFLYDIGQIAPRALSESTDLPPIFSAVDTIVTEAIKEVTDFQGKLAKKQAACKDFGRAEYDNPLIEEVRIISQPCGDLVKLYETIDGLVADNDGLLYCGGCSAPDHDDALKALLKILSRFHAHLAGAHQKFTQLLMVARMAGQAPRDDEHAAEKPVKLSAVGASSAP